MTRKPLQQLIAALLSGGVLIGGAAFAQEAEKNKTETSTSGGRLETVKVTAQKREESVQEVSTTIGVLGGSKLIDENIGRSAQEVLNYVPNASAYGAAHGRPRWWIRGIGAGNQQGDSPNPVGIYLDDVYISNASATGFPLFDLDRVEVLSGPQGTLWGKNTTGGAVNFISKKPSFKKDGYLKATYGSFDSKLFEAALGGAIVEDTLAGRVSVYQDDQGPRYKNQTTGNKEGSLNDTAVRAQLLANISTDLDANLNVHARRYQTNGSTGQAIGTGPGGRYYRSGATTLYAPSTGVNDTDGLPGINGNAWNWSDTDQTGVNLTVNYQLGRNALTSITAYEDYNVESAATPSVPFLSTQGGGNFTRNSYRERQVSQEFRLASPKEDKLSWIGGLFFFYDQITANNKAANLPGFTTFNPTTGATGASSANSLSLNGYNHKTLSKAIFGSVNYKFTDRFDTTFGWRWSTETKTYTVYRETYTNPTFASSFGWYDNIVANGTVGGTNYNGLGLTRNWDSVTYDFTPTYKLNATDRVYYTYAHGIKSGGFNTSVSTTDQIYAVDPEVLDNHEVGYKSEWADGRVIFNSALFRYKIKNYQVNVSGPYGVGGVSTTVLGNADNGHTYGAEFSLQALVTDRLRINANLGLLKTKFDNFVSHVPFANFDFSGNEFVRSPHVNALLQADYRIPVGSSGGNVKVGGDLRYTSKQYYYVNNQDVPENAQEAYTLANARISYSTPRDKDTFSFYVNNLTDKKYLAHSGIVNQTAFVTGWGQTWGAPRTYGISYVTRFF